MGSYFILVNQSYTAYLDSIKFFNHDKKISLVVAALILVTIMAMNFQNSETTKGVSNINLEMLKNIAQASGENGTCDTKPWYRICASGGSGSSSCTITVIVAGTGATYSVSCQSGCYACCFLPDFGSATGGAKCYKA